jgi:protease IV
MQEQVSMPPESGHHSTTHDSRPAITWERETLERLAFASLQEQKLARRWKAAVRLLWLVFFAVVAFMIYREVPTPTATTSPHTALIEIRGEIAANSQTNAQTVIDSMRSAFDDPGAQAVVLLIDSPGGSPVQAGMINDEIHRLKELHGKPVYAVVEETCASAAYYIAAAADSIYVDKASIVGSIGVLMDGFGFTGLMDKVGVERRLLTAGANKGFMDPFSPQSAEQKAFAQSMLNEIHEQFIAVVKQGRGERLQVTPELFSGLVWSGQKAVAMGLADGLGSLDYVAREVVKAEEIIDYTQRENVAERLAKRFGAGMGETALHLMKNGSNAIR